MYSPVGLKARRAISFGSALLLVLAVPLAISAQDASPDPSALASSPPVVASPEPSATPGTSPEASIGPVSEAVPGRLQQARYPKGGLGHVINDVIEGGPGYIAVGGGTPDGLAPQALVWLSSDGVLWEPATLKGKAVEGTMRAVAALPDGGYVAVGHDFKPETERAYLVRALVWFSRDGTKWKRVAMGKSAKGSMMWDLTATPEGVAAAGCVAGYHCDTGRIWTSIDGRTWELSDDITMAPYVIAADADGNLVVGGEDDAYDLVNSQATVASSAEAWVPQVLATPESQVNGVTAFGDGFLAAGTLWPRSGPPAPNTALQASVDGLEWELLQPERLSQMATHDISADGDLVALAGMDTAPNGGLVPAVLWTRDLESYESIALPPETKPNQAAATGVRVTDGGTRIFAFGSQKGRPMIWVSEVR